MKTFEQSCFDFNWSYFSFKQSCLSLVQHCCNHILKKHFQIIQICIRKKWRNKLLSLQIIMGFLRIIYYWIYHRTLRNNPSLNLTPHRSEMGFYVFLRRNILHHHGTEFCLTAPQMQTKIMIAIWTQLGICCSLFVEGTDWGHFWCSDARFT